MQPRLGARRLASALNPEEDRERLLDYAKELDAEADALDGQEPVTTHKQEQAQQQEATQAPPEGRPKESRNDRAALLPTLRGASLRHM